MARQPRFARRRFLKSGLFVAAALTAAKKARAALFPQTAEELAAGVTPTNYQFPPGNVLRYGASGNGVTSDSSEINRALSVDQAVHFPLPTKSYYVASGISTSYGAIKLVGDGIKTRIRSHGANHTLTVNSGHNDILIDSLWIDHRLGSGNWDAINLNGTETRIRNVDIDHAPRYGIYIGGYRTQISQVQMQAVLDTGIYILSTAALNSISDVTFVIAGANNPGKCIDVQSDFNSITGVVADQCIGYVLNLEGNYNAASSISARQPGGAIAEDFIRVPGNANTVTGATCDNVTGIGYLVSGNANTLRGCVTTDSSGIGASITGNSNTFEGRIFNAGVGSGIVHGVSISGRSNNINAQVKRSSGDDLNISGDFNAVRGEFAGSVVLTSGSEGNNLDIRCGSISVDAASAENQIKATCTSYSGIIANIASNANVLGLRINEGGRIGCVIGGDKNSGVISAFGATETCVEIHGDYNNLQVYASGATGEEMRIWGDRNIITASIEGDVVVDGDNNVILGSISGGITFNSRASNNRVLGFVGGTITDKGTDNDVSQTS